MNFKQWFILIEAKEDKQLALELVGNDQNIIDEINEVVPQGRQDTDQLTLLAAYYFSKHQNIKEVLEEFKSYLLYYNNNRMKLYPVNHTTKSPPSPWDNYIHWTQVIHANQSEDIQKEKAKEIPSETDFQNEKPIETSPNEEIKVYKANSPQQCIILGKGKTFCISKPGNTMWQSYRSNDISTFYFVYDESRDDRLSIVVVDARPNRIVLTDKENDTGKTLDPYTNELTTDSDSYIKYLKEKGIDITVFKNIGRTTEEQEEHLLLGIQKNDFEWFKNLSREDQSKYIGRGHRLTDQQFDYLWENKFKLLLKQYSSIGIKLNKHQTRLIFSDRDLRDSYLHNIINLATRVEEFIDKDAYDLLSPKDKEKLLQKVSGKKYYQEFLVKVDYPLFKSLHHAGHFNTEIVDPALIVPASDDIDKLYDFTQLLLKQKIKYGNTIPLLKLTSADQRNALKNALKSGNKKCIMYLCGSTVEKSDGQKITLQVPDGDPVYSISQDPAQADVLSKYFNGERYDKELMSYFLKEKECHSIGIGDMIAKFDDLENFDYLIKKISNTSISLGAMKLYTDKQLFIAMRNESMKIFKYFMGEKVTDDNGVVRSIPDTMSYVDKNITKERIESAIADKKFKIVEYLIKTDNEKLKDSNILFAIARSDSISMFEQFTTHQYKIFDHYAMNRLFNYAVVRGSFNLIKYILGEKIEDDEGVAKNIDDRMQLDDSYIKILVLEECVKSAYLKIFDYFVHKLYDAEANFNSFWSWLLETAIRETNQQFVSYLTGHVVEGKYKFPFDVNKMNRLSLQVLINAMEMTKIGFDKNAVLNILPFVDNLSSIEENDYAGVAVDLVNKIKDWIKEHGN